MTQPRTLILVLLSVIAGLLILSTLSTTPMLAQADSLSKSHQAPTTQPQRSLTVEEKRGRAFYLRGESSSGKEITAFVGEVDVPASTVPCAGCYGARGEGTTEGGVTAGNMSWSFLTKPYGHVDDGKRK